MKKVVVPAAHAGNRFLGSLNGLQIRALVSFPGLLPFNPAHLKLLLTLTKAEPVLVIAFESLSNKHGKIKLLLHF
jgi:hypothetical protein